MLPDNVTAEDFISDLITRLESDLWTAPGKVILPGLTHDRLEAMLNKIWDEIQHASERPADRGALAKGFIWRLRENLWGILTRSKKKPVPPENGAWLDAILERIKNGIITDMNMRPL
jgi:hypothetical protein